MKANEVTAFVLLMLLCVVALYDMFALFSYGRDATVSTVTMAWAREWPIIPFAAGCLMGHLFWSPGG